MSQGSAILRKAWQGKWALVTGASAGIGEAFAVELAAAESTSSSPRVAKTASKVWPPS